MSGEAWGAIATIIAIIVSRVLSHFEHKKTTGMMNGYLEKKIAEVVRHELNKPKP